MRALADILQQTNLTVDSVSEDGGHGWILLDKKKPNKRASVVWSNGGGWDHVSVAWSNRTPTWEEMCRVKKMFFRNDEVCVEYHPIESEYVNNHPYCLHIFKPQNEALPTPPAWMVGVKDGATMKETIEQANREMSHKAQTEKVVW